MGRSAGVRGDSRQKRGGAAGNGGELLRELNRIWARSALSREIY